MAICFNCEISKTSNRNRSVVERFESLNGKYKEDTEEEKKDGDNTIKKKVTMMLEIESVEEDQESSEENLPVASVVPEEQSQSVFEDKDKSNYASLYVEEVKDEQG